jgi:hypothetical protein
MSRDLDTIARLAAERLNTAVESAPLRAAVPSPEPVRRRPGLRLVLVTAALLVSSAVAVALVSELDGPPPTTATTTTTSSTTTLRLDPAVLAGPLSAESVTTSVPPTTVPPTTTPADTTPPPLEITSPQNGAELHQPEVVFRGTTEPGATVFAGKYQAEVDRDGSWSIGLILSKGENRVEFTARDDAGNETGAGVTVYLVVQETTTTTTTEPVDKPAEFSAHASFGICTLTPPYDVYYGTGEPGSTVHVVSDYGSGEVMVGEEGQWEIQVFFPESPPGQGFLVKVFDDLGREKTFEFVYQPEG